VFHRPEKGFNIDELNDDGDSALHLCARRGDAQRVELLVTLGSDLALQNSAGNTPLHVVVEESVREPTTKEAFLEVGIEYLAVGLTQLPWSFCQNSYEMLQTTPTELFLANCYKLSHKMRV